MTQQITEIGHDPALQEEIFVRLDALAEQLGVAAEFIWETLVNQMYLSGIMSLIGFLIVGFLLWTPTIILTVRRLCGKCVWTTPNAFDGQLSPEGIGVLASYVLTGIFMIISMLSAHDVITHIYNPEYWAFKEIASIL